MITLPTTTVDIRTRDAGADTWDPDADYTTVATAVPATISSPGGDHLRTRQADSDLVTATLLCNPIDTPVDELPDGLVLDHEDGRLYAIEWATLRTDALGLGHIRAGLTYRKGGAANE